MSGPLRSSGSSRRSSTDPHPGPPQTERGDLSGVVAGDLAAAVHARWRRDGACISCNTTRPPRGPRVAGPADDLRSTLHAVPRANPLRPGPWAPVDGASISCNTARPPSYLSASEAQAARAARLERCIAHPVLPRLLPARPLRRAPHDAGPIVPKAVELAADAGRTGDAVPRPTHGNVRRAEKRARNLAAPGPS